MAVINYIIPYVISLIQLLESWDYEAEEFKNSLWKNYYTMAVNQLLFYTIQLGKVR